MTDLREVAMQNQIDSLAAENRDLSAVNKDLSSEVQRLKEQNAFLRKNLFGRKSEKTKVVFDGQINLFDEAEQEAKKSAPEPELQTVQEHTRKKNTGQRREMLENLPHEKKLFTLSEEERSCKRCGTELVSMGEQLIRTEVQFIPAEIKVIDIYQETFECRACRKEQHFSIEKPNLPKPVLAHSMASASSIAHVMMQKYFYAVPLSRQEKEWHTLGIKLSRGTMANWIILSARDWLQPITALLKDELLKEPCLHADETPVQVLGEKGRKNTTKSYMWLYASGKYEPLHKIRLFDYQASRSGSCAKEYLQGFHGYLHTDAYAGYEKVQDVTRCLCWAHARRYFVDAVAPGIDDLSESLAKEGIEQINKLFEIEKELADLSIEERQEQRLQREKPLLQAFWSWIETRKGSVLPKSRLCQAMNYAAANRKGLEAYLQDGRCNISNNLAEGSIRPFTIGRKNWLFSGSPKGATASAAVYSLIETCKANEIDPYKYLIYLLEHLPNEPFQRQPEILQKYLPWSSEVLSNCK